MKRVAMAALALVLGLGCATVCAQDAEPAVSNDDILVTIVVPKIGQAVENVMGFLHAVEPTLPDMLTPKLSDLVYSDGLMGVQQAGPLVFMLLNPKKFQGTEPVPWILLIPTTEPEEYFNNVELRLPRKEPQDGLELFIEEKREIDFEHLVAPEGEEPAAPAEIVTQIKHFMMPMPDKWVVSGQNADLVRGVAALLMNRKLTIDTTGAPDTVMRVAADLSQLIATFKDDIEDFRQTMPMMMMAAKGQMTPDQAAGLDGQVKILNAELAALLSVAGQLQDLRLEIGANKDRVRFSERVRPVPGTLAEKFLAAQEGAKVPPLMDGLPEDCVMAFSAYVQGLELLDEPLRGLMSTFIADVEDKEGDLAKAMEALDALIQQSLALYGGRTGIAMPSTTKAGLSFVGFGDTKDGPKTRELLRTSLATGAPIHKFYESMGMTTKFTPNAATHKGVPIDLYTFAMKGMPEEAEDMIQKMYGDLSQRVAYVDNRYVFAFGKGADEMVRQMIDLSKGEAKPLSESEQYQATVAGLPANRCGEGFFSLSGFLGVVSRMGLPGMMPLEVTPAKPISMAVVADKTGVTADGYVPAEEVKAVYTAIMQAMMQAMMGGPGGPE